MVLAANTTMFAFVQRVENQMRHGEIQFLVVPQTVHACFSPACLQERRQCLQLSRRGVSDRCHFSSIEKISKKFRIEQSHLLISGGSDYKLIYRHYATLYFVFCVDSSESELGILDLIQVG